MKFHSIPGGNPTNTVWVIIFRNRIASKPIMKKLFLRSKYRIYGCDKLDLDNCQKPFSWYKRNQIEEIH
jgi:hypothetical protein